MNKKSIRLIATLMAIVMVMGVLTVVPLSASAYSSSDANAPGTGTVLPADAEVYDGVPSTSLAGSGTEEDPYLIANAKDFVYFRDVLLPTLTSTFTITTTCGGSAASSYTKTITDVDGAIVSEETIATKAWGAKSFASVCYTGESVDTPTYYKLTGNIYLNDADYGPKKGYLAAPHANTTTTTNTMVIDYNEQGELYIVNSEKNADMASGAYTSSVKNADGTTTTYTGALGSISILETHDFNGVLDGNGYTIYNVQDYVTTHESRYSGIFRVVNGTIKNLNIDGLRMHSSWNDQERHRMGGLACYLNGTVENVHIKNAYMKSNSIVGAIAADMNAGAQIINCSVEGSFQNRNTANSSGTYGGLVGAAHGSDSATTIIRDCVSDVNMEGFGSKPHGGIVGSMGGNNVVISNCVNYGNFNMAAIYSGSALAGTNVNAGGIAGQVSSGGSGTVIKDCTNYGNIKATNAAGGILGAVDNASTVTFAMEGCTNYGEITCDGIAGGLVGTANASSKFLTMTNCVNQANVTSKASYAGGLVGKIGINGYGYGNGEPVFYNCASHGNITAATSHAAFIVGYVATNNNNTIPNAINFVATGTVQAPTYVAAIAGEIVHTTNRAKGTSTIRLENVWIDGTLNATADEGIAAIYCANTNTVTFSPSSDKYSAAHNIYVVSQNGFFNLTDKNGSAVTVLAYGYKDGDGVDTADKAAVTAGAVKYAIETYNNGTESVTGVPPTFDVAILSNGTLKDSLNTMATSKGYTPWIQGKTSPILLTNLGFSGATMTLGGNMTLNMKLAADKLAELDVLHVTFIDINTHSGVQATLDEAGEYYVVSYDKSAADMAKSSNMCMFVTLTNGTTYRCTNVLNYSPADYLLNLYNDYTVEKKNEEKADSVVALVTNMLAYGAEAEAKRDGVALDETETAKKAISESVSLGFTFPYTDEHLTGVMTGENNEQINAIANTGASLTGGISITFTMKNTAYTTLTVEDKTYTVNGGVITFENILPANITKNFTLTFSGDDVEDVTAQFCVGDFLETRRTGNEKALAEATIRYMMAVQNYAQNLPPVMPELRTYTVTFVDTDGTVLGTDVVAHAGAASVPGTPIIEGMRMYWDKDFSYVTENMTVTTQYVAESTMNVLQWNMSEAPNEALFEQVNETDIILYTGTVDPTKNVTLPEGWEVKSSSTTVNKVGYWQAVIYNTAYYTYDKTAGAFYKSPPPGFIDNGAAYAIQLTENSTGKQFVMTVMCTYDKGYSNDVERMKLVMSETMKALVAKYSNAAGIVISFQAQASNGAVNTGLHESGFYNNLDNTAFIEGYDLVSHYEAATLKDQSGLDRDVATYLLTYAKEGHEAIINSAETITAVSGVSLYDGIRSNITFDKADEAVSQVEESN